MKLMFAADIHGCLPAAQRVSELFEHSGARYLVLLGDLLNHGPRNPLPQGYQPAAVAELFNRQAERIIAVRGNCDSEVDQMLLNFPITALWQQVLTDNGRLFLSHGHLYHPDNLPPLCPGDVLVYGHTHLPQAARSAEGVGLFNPGSVALPKGGHPPSYGVFDGAILSIHALESCAEIARLPITP